MTFASDVLRSRKTAFICGGVLGIIWFLIVYGFRVLDVTYDDWILDNMGDLNQHYTGWLFYRQSEWHFPLGLADGLSSSGAVSCVYTDSIPLFALLFKLLSPLLPDTFQYIGLWGMTCYFMQGAFGMLIARRFSSNALFCLSGSMLFVTAPTVMQRMFSHEALAGQWLILSAICIWLYYDSIRERGKLPYILWSLECSAAVLVHMYFLPMIFMVMAAYILTDLLLTKKWRHSVRLAVISILSAAAVMWLIGAFHGGGSYAAGGLGMFNSNLNTFFNSMGFSGFIDPLPTIDYQGEGMGYLGLGTITAVTIAAVTAVVKRKEFFGGKAGIYTITALLLFLASFIIAVSVNYSFGSTRLFTIPLPYLIKGAMSVFRASGRFIWIADYMFITASLACLSRTDRKKIVSITLAACAVFQIADLWEYTRGINKKFSPEKEHSPFLSGDAIDTAAESADNIVFLPIETDYLNNMEIYFSFAEYAYDHGMTMSSFYLARSDYDSIKDYADQQGDDLLSGKGDDDALYVFLVPVDEEDYPENVYFYDCCGYQCARCR